MKLWKDNKIIKYLADKLLKLWLSPIFIIMSISERNKDILLGYVLKNASRNSKEYHRFSSFPKESNYLQDKIFEKSRHNDIAIVIQGPLVKQDNFTINTISLYKSLYPGAGVIVSLWNTEEKSLIDKCIKIGAIVVQSELPNNRGALNLNYQIISSKSGILKAKELGFKYVIKTRSDQRISNPFSITLLKNNLKLFPVSSDGELNSRIVFLGNLINSYSKLAFHISDFLIFGDVSDVEKVFDIPLDTRPYAFQEDVLKVYRKHYQFVWQNECNREIFLPNIADYNFFIDKLMAPEQYILIEFTKKFLKNMNFGKDSYLEIYIRLMQKYLIVLDSDMLGLYWLKKSFQYLQPDILKRGNQCGKLTYSDWLNYYLEWKKLEIVK